MAGSSLNMPLAARTDPARFAIFAWAAIAFSSLLFAVFTWDTGSQRHGLALLIRHFAFPVLLVELAVLSLAVAAGHSPLRLIREWPAIAKGALAVLVATMVFTALFVAPSPGLAIARSSFWLLHLFAGIGAMQLARDRLGPITRIFWPAVVLSSLLVLLLVVLLVWAIPDPAHYNWEFLGLASTNVRHLGFYCATGAAAAFGLAMSGRPGPRSRLLLLATASMLALSFWSGTRGAPAAFFCAFLAGQFFLPGIRTLRSWLSLAGAYAGGALLSTLHQVPDKHYGLLRLARSTQLEQPGGPDSGRLQMWSQTLDLIGQSPLFGWGAGQYPWLARAIGEPGFAHPHNAALQILLNWGAIGAACIALLGGALLLRIWPVIRSPGAELTPTFLVLASLAILALVDGALFYPYPILMIAACLALLAAERARRADPDRPGAGVGR